MLYNYIVVSNCKEYKMNTLNIAKFLNKRHNDVIRVVENLIKEIRNDE